MNTLAIPSIPRVQPVPARLLVADDQPHIVTALEMLLGSQGYQTHAAYSPAAVLDALQSGAFDAIVMDLNYARDTTGGGEGLELVARIRAIDQTIPLVVMTAWSSVGLAVEAMRRGASDFVQKPWNNGELLEKIREQVDSCRSTRRLQHRQEEESWEATEVQKGLLPGVLPKIAGYEISAATRSMHFVGGDYYNVVRLSDTQTALCIADVAGKGLPGALLMANLQAALKPFIGKDIEPREVCSRLNQTLCEIMPVNKFISLFYAVLETGDGKSGLATSEGRLRFCNAGHNPPLLVRPDGSARELESSGAILGKFPDWEYTQDEVCLESGDTLLLFTDGVAEAQCDDGEPFGERRIGQLASEADFIDAAGGMKKISDYCGGKFQDDATLLVLKSNC
jgi:phosphoserine phosphatase RsbU/P